MLTGGVVFGSHTEFDELKLQVKSGMMNSFQPEDNKAFDVEAHRLATNADKVSNDWLAIHNRLQRRTLKNDDALDMISKFMDECRCISVVATAVTKHSFSHV